MMMDDGRDGMRKASVESVECVKKWMGIRRW